MVENPWMRYDVTQGPDVARYVRDMQGEREKVPAISYEYWPSFLLSIFLLVRVFYLKQVLDWL